MIKRFFSSVKFKQFLGLQDFLGRSKADLAAVKTKHFFRVSVNNA
jgi:hypothetical protein